MRLALRGGRGGLRGRLARLRLRLLRVPRRYYTAVLAGLVGNALFFSTLLSLLGWQVAARQICGWGLLPALVLVYPLWMWREAEHLRRLEGRWGNE